MPKRDKLRGRTRQAVAANRVQRSSMPAWWVLGGAKRKRSLFLCPGQRFLTRTHPLLFLFFAASADIVSCVNGTDSSDQRCACPQSDTCTSCTLQVRRLSREHCVYWPTVEQAITHATATAEHTSPSRRLTAVLLFVAYNGSRFWRQDCVLSKTACEHQPTGCMRHAASLWYAKAPWPNSNSYCHRTPPLCCPPSPRPSLFLSPFFFPSPSPPLPPPVCQLPELAAACAARCNDTDSCAAFNTISSSGQCCLYSAYGRSATFSLPNSIFYEMSQCAVCTDTHFKEGRVCKPLSQPPQFAAETPTDLALPHTAPEQTRIARLNASAEAGFGPVTFALRDPGAHGGALAINATGELYLTRPLPLPRSYAVDILVRDARSRCVTRDPEFGLVNIEAGPCVTTLQLTVQSLVLLGCPNNINALVPLSASTATVSWAAPALPAFASNVNITRDLGDAVSAEDTRFTFPVGFRRVTYTTIALAIGGPLVCSFDVDVRHGFALTIDHLVSSRTINHIQEFMVVDEDEQPNGLSLPAFNGSASPQALRVALRSPVTTPFTIAPPVRWQLCWWRVGGGPGGGGFELLAGLGLDGRCSSSLPATRSPKMPAAN